MNRQSPLNAEVADGSRHHGPEDDNINDANEIVERKFHDTLEEVFALKQILQDFLTEPTPRLLPPTNAQSSSSNPVHHLRHLSRHEYHEPVPNEPQTQAHFTERPKVRASRTSERLLRQSVHFEPNFQARLHYYSLKTQRKREQIQAEADEKVHEELKLAPTINQRSKRIQRSVHHLHAWGHEKKLKLEELRQAEQRREVEQVMSAPHVCRVSQRMTQDRVDDLAQCKVEDRLHLLGLIYEYQQEERMIEAAKHREEAGSKPRLAPHSNGLMRTQRGQVHERLHELSKRPPPTSDREQQHSSGSKFAKETVEAAIDRLAEIGVVYRNNREEKAKQREQQLSEMQQSQKISTKSRALAEKARSKAANQHATHHRKCPCCRQPEEDDASDVQPVSLSQAAAIYERQLQWQARKERRCQAERERREAEQVAALDFCNPHYRSAWDPLRPAEPSKSESSEDDVSSPGKIQRRQRRLHKTNHSFFEKSKKWATNREEQLTRERKVWDEINLRDCTFKPKLQSVSVSRRTEHREAAARTPRSLLKPGHVTLDQGFFSRTDLRTPMLGVEDSDVSSDDCVEEGYSSDEPLEHGGSDSDSDEQEGGVTFFNHGEQVW